MSVSDPSNIYSKFLKKKPLPKFSGSQKTAIDPPRDQQSFEKNFYDLEGSSEEFDSDLDSPFSHKEYEVAGEAGTMLALDQVEAKASAGAGSNLTLYNWKTEFGGNGKKFPIARNETVAYVARRILNHNLSDGYTLVSLIGKSGTGKSTLTRTLVHRLHKQLERKNIQYAVNWFEKQDISRVNDIIKTFAKGVNRILVFEDASYGDRELSQEESEALMAELTYVRHTLQANVIFMIQIHYSKALGPFLRDGDVTLITSITPKEKDNYYKEFGYENQPIIKVFFRKYGSMIAEGYYYANLDESTTLKYYRKHPFKIAFCMDFGSPHFVNYPAEGCAYCEKKLSYSIPEERVAESELELFQSLTNQSKRGVTNALRQCIRWMGFFKAGEKTLEPHQMAIMKKIIQYYEDHPADWQNVVNELHIGRSVDHVLRQRGIKLDKLTAEEKRRAKRLDAANQKRIKRSLERTVTPIQRDDGDEYEEERPAKPQKMTLTPDEERRRPRSSGKEVIPTTAMLEAAGVPGMDSGQTNEDIEQ